MQQVANALTADIAISQKLGKRDRRKFNSAGALVV
jgi:hypothetical protein